MLATRPERHFVVGTTSLLLSFATPRRHVIRTKSNTTTRTFACTMLTDIISCTSIDVGWMRT